MKLSDWLSIIAIVASFGGFILHAWLYRRMSASQMDDNIINATNSIIALLEKAKKLDQPEKELLRRWLDDWDYFRPPNIFTNYKGSKAKDETIEMLKRYFDELPNKSP